MHSQATLFDSPPTRPSPGLPDITRRKHGGNRNSEEANTRVQPHKQSLRETIYQFLRSSEGATCEEVSRVLGLRYTTVSGRISELKTEGRVRPSGKRRNTETGSPADILEAL